ncbi:MAG: DUF2802 domain-containing protein [Gammaproteobacteria bacterium]|nr:DUF2802 domain-containing protein [Gammaproteobacteria bacterium]MCF6230443.1 DUF2802 domain-containing protein [Gammaproteobacteria bacterium]
MTEWSVVVLLMVLAALLVTVFVVTQKQQKQLQQQLRQQRSECEQLQSQFKLLVSGAQGMGERIHSVEHALSTSKRAATQSSLATSGDVSVRQAIELARKGATVDELVDICGLSRGEAELMSTIHNIEAR